MGPWELVSFFSGGGFQDEIMDTFVYGNGMVDKEIHQWDLSMWAMFSTLSWHSMKSWLVHRDPYNGWVALGTQTPPEKVVGPQKDT